TGGTITINGNKYQNGDIFTIPAANMTAPIIPVTVTSKTGKKNIYTLVLQATEPVIPATIYVCTSLGSNDNAQSPFNRIVFATIGGNTEYRIKLPAPNSCGPIDFSNQLYGDHQTQLQILAALKQNPIVWYSSTNSTYLGKTNFGFSGASIIPTFTWAQDSSDPSGYSIITDVRDNCSFDTNKNEFAPICTLPENKPAKAQTKTSEDLSIQFCSVSTDGNIGAVNNLVQGNGGSFDPVELLTQDGNTGLHFSKQEILPEVGECKSIALLDTQLGEQFRLAQYIYQSKDTYSPLYLGFASAYVTHDDERYFAPGGDASDTPQQGIPLNMMAEIKYCTWTLSWSAKPNDAPIHPEYEYWYTSLSLTQTTCNFPINPS
ncbi:MAG TPA: hypothetical protein VKR58_03160, partial [Aquella sp.]|nr:hypothetical protein [Aquella sp.]